jgi:protein-tyrosine phosphatase
MGNICRSPAAEHVMKTLVREDGLESQIQCDSCGTIGYHRGESPDARMVESGKRRGFSISGASRPIEMEDFDQFDLIYTMDEDNYKNVCALTKNKGHIDKVHKFCESLTKFSDPEVPDPYYGGLQGFEHVIDLLIDGCSEIIKNIKNTPK